jgi:hypothetical protein
MQEYLKKLTDVLDLYLVKKAPYTLPDKAKETIVKFSPYISILILVLAIPAFLAIFSFSAMMGPFAMAAGVQYGFGYYVAQVVLVISLVIDALAIPGLMARKVSGWNLMFYSTLVNAVYTLFRGDIVGLLIGTTLSLYVLFQVKSYYK